MAQGGDETDMVGGAYGLDMLDELDWLDEMDGCGGDGEVAEQSDAPTAAIPRSPAATVRSVVRVIDLADEFGFRTIDALDICAAIGLADASGGTALSADQANGFRRFAHSNGAVLAPFPSAQPPRPGALFAALAGSSEGSGQSTAAVSFVETAAPATTANSEVDVAGHWAGERPVPGALFAALQAAPTVSNGPVFGPPGPRRYVEPSAVSGAGSAAGPLAPGALFTALSGGAFAGSAFAPTVTEPTFSRSVPSGTSLAAVVPPFRGAPPGSASFGPASSASGVRQSGGLSREEAAANRKILGGAAVIFTGVAIIVLTFLYPIGNRFLILGAPFFIGASLVNAGLQDRQALRREMRSLP